VKFARWIFSRKVKVQKADVPRKLDASYVEFFAFEFSLFAAVDFHHFLPRDLSTFIHVPPLVGAFLHRGMVSIIAFFVLKYVVKIILLRVLGLNRLTPPPQHL
jgi:hypothetical protein